MHTHLPERFLYHALLGQLRAQAALAPQAARSPIATSCIRGLHPPPPTNTKRACIRPRPHRPYTRRVHRACKRGTSELAENTRRRYISEQRCVRRGHAPRHIVETSFRGHTASSSGPMERPAWRNPVYGTIPLGKLHADAAYRLEHRPPPLRIGAERRTVWLGPGARCTSRA